MTADALTAALAYASHGWPVFPVAPTVDGRCGCGWPADRCSSPGKHPLNKGGCRTASTDREQITAWWTRWPTANVGVATGRAAGLAVLDVDGEQGRRSLARIEAEHGPLPGALTAITSRGCHLFYRWPTGLTIGSGLYGPGLDHRGEGGYIIAAPSVHPSGHVYRWLNESGHPEPWALPLADWPLDALPVQKPQRSVVVPLHKPASAGVLGGLVRAILEAPVGERNARLNWAAYRAGEHIRSGRLDQVQAVTALQLSAERIGLTAAETRATIASGIASGMAA